MKKNINQLPFDLLQLFGEDTNLTANGVIGNVVDTKGLGFGKGTVVMDVKSADDADGTETYEVAIEWSLDEAFTVPVDGGTHVITRGDLGRKFIPVNNQVAGATDGADAMYRFVRLNLTVGGDTPSLTVTAFLSETIVG